MLSEDFEKLLEEKQKMHELIHGLMEWLADSIGATNICDFCDRKFGPN